jgi:GNAT superfamily N-acetyltransferase
MTDPRTTRQTGTAAEITIRLATLDDAEGIAAVHIAAWLGAYRGIIPDDHLDNLSVERHAAGWRRSLTDAPPRVTTLVALVAGRVRGFARFGSDRGDTCGAELQVLNVDPDAWGGGVGGALLSAAEAALAADGFTAAVLWVLRDNPRARSVYERRGWTYDNAEQDLDFNGTAVREVRYAKSL